VSRAFTSLRVPNYRRYFAGQVVSLAGNWMQIVAETWLVLRLTGSGALVGVAAALQFLPMLLFGALGGVLADRVPKRRLLTITQTLMALPALALFGLVETGSVQTWMVLALILARGAVNAADNPARQSFVSEMVGRERLVNAVSLNSVIVHVARIAGPAVAALVIATAGVGPCFLINALSFVAMLVALRRMDPRALEPAPVVRREPGQLRAAVRYVLATPALRTPLAMMAVIGTLSYNFQVLLPLLAHFTWHGSASAYAALTCAMGVGSVAGALVAGARGRIGPGLLAGAAAAFGAATLVAAAAPTLALQMLVLAPLGAASVTFAAGVNSTMQLTADPAMRGRVMALYSVVFLGSTPIGAPLIGLLAESAGPRAGLAVGGVAALATGAVAAWSLRRAAARVPAGAVLSGD
jgi:MFS family permease